METIVVSIDGWMNTENVVYNGKLFSFKKEGYSATCGNMDDPVEHYAKWKKSVFDKRTNTAWFDLYEVTKVVKLTEMEGSMVGAKD